MTRIAYALLLFSLAASTVVLAAEPAQRNVPWTSSRIKGSPDPAPPYRVRRIAPKLSFTNPVIFTKAPGTKRMFLVELTGKVFSFDPRSSSPRAELVIDLKSKIKDLKQVYGLTFHPKFEQNHLCYICYVTEAGGDHGTRVSRFRVSQLIPPRIDGDSEDIILTWKAGGHNGGCLKFGPKDGYLYITAGDGGPAFPPDPAMTGQDVSDLLAGVMRIDVDRRSGGKKYHVPRDNPFVGVKNARPEVWAFGMRNPWKMSFDGPTGDLWIGDVGWELWEMIYRVQKGGNYGWSLVEGQQPVHQERPRGPTPVLLPTAAHSHIESRSITGGHVYRGKRLAELDGEYVYGDYVTGKIWGLKLSRGKTKAVRELAESRLQVICFGLGGDGEVYVVDYQGGIYELVRNPAAKVNRDFPTRLSQTGIFSNVARHELARGVVGYQINAEPWADGATCERFVALPGNTRLSLHDKTNVWLGAIKGEWRFPDGGLLGKTVSLPVDASKPNAKRRLETQILLMDGDVWRPFNYIWNDEQTDAVLAGRGGFDRKFSIRDSNSSGGARQQTWHFASRAECLLCHTTRGGSVYGFRLAQLSRDGQLAKMASLGMFDHALPQKVGVMANPFDEAQPLQKRARAYLHVNCAHCHRRGGGGTAAMDISIEKTLKQTNLLQARPTQGSFGIHGAEVFAQGDPYRSLIYYRMAKLGRGHMPHFGSNTIDKAGLKLIHDWIASFDGKPRQSIVSLRKRQRALVEKLRNESSVRQILESPSGALMLLRQIDEGRLSPALRGQAISLGNQHQDPAIRGLFERFVPEQDRLQRLGTAVRPQQILAMRGNVMAGRRLFISGKGVQCRNCHQLSGVGKVIGPDLKQIGKKYSRRQILESILSPSKTIDPKYTSYLIETSRGRVLTGLLVRKNDKQLTIMAADGKQTTLKRKDVELMAPSRKSMMPDLLFRDMTAQQVADLVAFLKSLR